MSDPLFDADDAATPLTPDEKQALIPSYITLRRELNEAEQIGITSAEEWAFSRKRDVLNETFLSLLHKRMFKDVWRWAGQLRTTPRNIGVEPWNITSMLRNLIEDVRYWVLHKIYPPDEITARFHHRLVLIHPFPNGNGRHARLAADLLLVKLGQERFTWGRVSLVNAGETRQKYVTALRAADAHDLQALLAFVRS
jgi:Fic-DOC domain mobile mystery protein B